MEAETKTATSDVDIKANKSGEEKVTNDSKELEREGMKEHSNATDRDEPETKPNDSDSDNDEAESNTRQLLETRDKTSTSLKDQGSKQNTDVQANDSRTKKMTQQETESSPQKTESECRDTAPFPKGEEEPVIDNNSRSETQLTDERADTDPAFEDCKGTVTADDNNTSKPVKPDTGYHRRGEEKHDSADNMFAADDTRFDSLGRQPYGTSKGRDDDNETIDEVFKANTPRIGSTFEEQQNKNGKELPDIHEPRVKQERQNSMNRQGSSGSHTDGTEKARGLNFENGLPAIEPRQNGSGKSSRPSKEEDDNPFFTGRLPTLLPREHSKQSINEREETSITKQDSGITEVSANRKFVDFEADQTDPGTGQNSDEDGRKLTKSDTFTSNPRPSAPTPSRRQGNQYKKEITRSELSPIEPERTPTPSRKIKELIRGMKTPDKEASVENYKPPSPKHIPNKKEHQCSPNTPIGRGGMRATKSEIENSNMTIGDITSVSNKMAKTTLVHERESQFENMQHIQNITQYVQDNEKEASIATEKSPGNRTDNGQERTREHRREPFLSKTYTIGFQSNGKGGLDTSGGKQRSQIKFMTADTDAEFNRKGRANAADDTANLDVAAIKKSTSEAELQNIIASAKTAIGHAPNTSPTGTQTDLNMSAVSNMSVHGEPIERNAKMKRRQQENYSRNSRFSNDIPLICSSCLQPDTTIHNSGFCQICKQYLCNTCIVLHTMAPETQSHEILATYCKNELKINKYVNATAYCSDCAVFYCSKCAMEHVGFRKFRRHRIIQSSFFQKPTRKVARADDLDASTEREALDDSKSSSKESRKNKHRDKVVQDLKRYNPYRFAYSKVLPSLYPGPKRRIGESYTAKPKWPQSSIPTLPYLVQPKPMRERLLNAPYISQHNDYASDENQATVAKMKKLKNTYGLHEDAQTYQLKGPNHTARAARASKSMEDLPDVEKRISHSMGGKLSVHTTINRKTPGTVELKREHCLSIPFPSGEKKLSIQAMTVLLNGKLVVLDKNNNNLKLYDRYFTCKAALQFRSHLIDASASNLCPTDVYAATAKHVYEISATTGMELKRKIKVELKRIEGLTCWKFGLLVVSKKTDITWEVRLMDYRGNLKSKLEILNPLTCEIETSALFHVTMTRGGKCLSISDAKNACVITVDVITRKVTYETTLGEEITPSYLASDGENNVYVSAGDKVLELSKTGSLLGVILEKPEGVEMFGSIVFNKRKGQLYVQASDDVIRVYKVK